MEERDDEGRRVFYSSPLPDPPVPVLDDDQKQFIRTTPVEPPASIEPPEEVLAELSSILEAQGARRDDALVAAKLAYQWTAHAVRFGKANPPGDVTFIRKATGAAAAAFRRVLWHVGKLNQENFYLEALVRAEIADGRPDHARERVAADLEATMRTLRRFEMLSLSNKLAGWRPAKAATFQAIQMVADAYRTATGARIGYSQVAATNRLAGPFVTFAQAVAGAAGAPMFFSDAMIKRVRDKRQKAPPS